MKLEAVAAIKSSNGRLELARLSYLQAAEIAASKHGFFDLDVKDNDSGAYRIIAYGPNKSVQARGKTLEEAVERLLEVFYGS